MSYVPIVTCIVSFIFAITVLDQYFARRKPYQLLWAVGMFMYALSTFTEFWWNVVEHAVVDYKLWYLVGAILVAAYLGQGTLYLLMKRRHAHIIMALLGAVTLYAAARIFTVNIDVSGLTTLGSKNLMPPDIGITTGIMNVFGTVALVGGAAYSAFIFWRKRILPHRVVGNVLIAVGALFPAIGGSLITTTRASTNLSFVFELVGAVIMFVGFLRTKEVFGLYRFPLVHGFGRMGGEAKAPSAAPAPK